MSYNAVIRKKLQADKYLAQLLEKSIKEVGRQSVKQANLIYKGFERLSWYASCFTDNYQDVCASQKSEDVRFGLALTQLTKRKDVIFDMVNIYIEQITINLSDKSRTNIERSLVKYGALYSSNSLTNKSFAAMITSAICSGFTMSSTLQFKLQKRATSGISAVALYGYVQIASQAAQELKKCNLIYYSMLYREELEMLYFLIEPVINSSRNYESGIYSDEEIASRLRGLLDQ